MVTFFATNTNDLNMSYRMFSRLRDGIAMRIDKDFGTLYKDDMDIPEQVMIGIDKDILDFLLQSDARGEIEYKVCKKVLNELQAAEFDGINKDHIDTMREKLCIILKECYSHRRKLRWS